MEHVPDQAPGTGDTAQQLKTFIRSNLQYEMGPPHGDIGPLDTSVTQTDSRHYEPQPLTRSNVTIHDTIWSSDLPQETSVSEGETLTRPAQRVSSATTGLHKEGQVVPGSSSGIAAHGQPHAHRLEATLSESDSEQSYSSQDTMILREAPDTSVSLQQQQLPLHSGNALNPQVLPQLHSQRLNPDSARSALSTKSTISDHNDIGSAMQGPDIVRTKQSHMQPSDNVKVSDNHEQLTSIASGNPRATFVLSKSPGYRQERNTASSHQDEPVIPSGDHAGLGIRGSGDDVNAVVETVEELREGSPDPVSYEALYLAQPWIPMKISLRSPEPNEVDQLDVAGNVEPSKEEEDKDDGYDSPGGQSSETSSNESNTTGKSDKKDLSEMSKAPMTLKSILPKPRAKNEPKPGPPKRVRFETLEEESTVLDPTVSSDDFQKAPTGVKEKKKNSHSYLFEMDVKIPSFKEMNKMLRDKRTRDSVPSNPGEASSLEKKLQMLALEDIEAPEQDSTVGDMVHSSEMLSPGSVVESRKVLYSQKTHTSASPEQSKLQKQHQGQMNQPSQMVYDSETGEWEYTNTGTAGAIISLHEVPTESTPVADPRPRNEEDSFRQFIDQRNSTTSNSDSSNSSSFGASKDTSEPPIDISSSLAKSSDSSLSVRKSERRVHFADPLISSESEAADPESPTLAGSEDIEHKDTSSSLPVTKPVYPPVTREEHAYSPQSAEEMLPKSKADYPFSPSQLSQVSSMDSYHQATPMNTHHAMAGQEIDKLHGASHMASVADTTSSASSGAATADYIRSSDTKALLHRLRGLQKQSGLNRSLLRSGPLSSSIEDMTKVSKDDSFVRLRKITDDDLPRKPLPRPMSDYAMHSFSMPAGAQNAHGFMPGPAKDFDPNEPDQSLHTDGASAEQSTEQGRPRFATSADIYSLLEKSRHNPFRPVPGPSLYPAALQPAEPAYPSSRPAHSGNQPSYAGQHPHRAGSHSSGSSSSYERNALVVTPRQPQPLESHLPAAQPELNRSFDRQAQNASPWSQHSGSHGEPDLSLGPTSDQNLPHLCYHTSNDQSRYQQNCDAEGQAPYYRGATCMDFDHRPQMNQEHFAPQSSYPATQRNEQMEHYTQGAFSTWSSAEFRNSKSTAL